MEMIINNESQILVVDDSAAVRGIVRKIIVKLGCTNVDEASDGATALAKMN
jgi:two-component system, chemotaxis family, chemotaxis protein CheY